MSTVVRESATTQAPTTALASAFDCPRRVELLRVDGVLPVGLEGLFMQASPHPAAARRLSHPDLDGGPCVMSGIWLNSGTARWYRAATEHTSTGLFGSIPALAPAVDLGRHGPDRRCQTAIARPVVDPAGRWHTVATYPGLGYAEHLIADSDGTVLRARPFPLDGSPLISSVALTESHVVLFDLPVVFNRAAAMVGQRFPYVWQPGRQASVGLLPRTGTDPRVRWFPIEPCHVSDIVNAYQDGPNVIVDAVSRPRAFERETPAERPAPMLRRWTIDQVTGQVLVRQLAPAVETAVVDGRFGGTHHRFLYGARTTSGGSALVRHDTATGRTVVRQFGEGTLVGRPQFVARQGAEEGDGFVVALVERVAQRRSELVVLDALDIAGPPRAVVHIPVDLRAVRRTVWYPAPVAAPRWHHH